MREHSVHEASIAFSNGITVPPSYFSLRCSNRVCHTQGRRASALADQVNPSE